MGGISTDHYIEPEIGPPGAVFGLAAYNGEAHVAEAIESLLTQTRRDLAVVIVDDCSTDGTAEICRRYVELDARVTYERNDRRLGLVRNWRRAFTLAAERHPGARYFAWASDHDVWDARWLELLAAELDAHPEGVLAYPLTVRIDDQGSEYPTRERLFDTGGVADPRERVRRVAGELRGAGEMVYGLMRRSAMERAGPFPLAVLSDRLYLERLALEGELRQVHERLWYRRFRAGVAMSNARQRRTAFPEGAPLVAYAPWWLTHPVLLARSTGSWRLGVEVAGRSTLTALSRKQERIGRSLRWRKRHALERLGLRRPPEARVQTESASSPPLDTFGGDVLELRPGADLRPADLAVSVGFLDGLSPEELERVVDRLHELGVETLVSIDRESPELRAALGRRYWLRRLWVGADWPGGRKPDPLTGPVPQEPGQVRHLLGRRRLLPS
jgi:hypothetical protein